MCISLYICECVCVALVNCLDVSHVCLSMFNVNSTYIYAVHAICSNYAACFFMLHTCLCESSFIMMEKAR